MSAVYLSVAFPCEKEAKLVDFEKAAGFKDKRILWNSKVVVNGWTPISLISLAQH